ncbi:peptidoglycan-binding protein [Streptomyces spinoverrucosus]|uniref:peptidoglycan-binding protein n=1 Tax=Streptomyces spinoverrucosus TaxID=284043 RepID=UPI0018C3DD36|nr:peptidoglycan-binding protein [Streptomyces spinoverrucosus]MBG0854516.1 peptidoglycan-binding protein [Streptomyces spinoverrucosus]
MTGFLRPADSPAGRRAWLAGLCESIPKADSKNELLDLIDSALSVDPPQGDPGTLESLSRRYRDRVDDVGAVHDRVERVARKGLPEVWVGDTSVLASEVVSAANRAVLQMGEAFHGGATVLLRLADALADAQRQDTEGRGKMRQAKSTLGGRDGFFDDLHEDDDEEFDRLTARFYASDGVDLMHKAAVAAEDAVRAAVRDLNKWAAEARAGKMDTGELTAVDKLMLADTGAAGTPTELNEILTADDLARAGQRMDRLNRADEAAMERMLAQSGSPQERAYLMKALAAGHSVGEIAEFQGKIAGKDPEWLRRHLTPVVTAEDSMDDEGLAQDGSNNNKDSVLFHNQLWVQGGDGSEGTCVASSTVNARAMLDPIYALDLTGGPSGQEDDPEAFRQRLVAEQHRLHTEGEGGDNWTGMGQEGQERIADSTLGSATGDDYRRHDLDSANDRRAILDDVEKAVAEGKPVPVDVSGDEGAHAMMIIGQEGDRLQIYNPWGTTTWVSEDDFINGNMGKASNSELNNAYQVYVPQ